MTAADLSLQRRGDVLVAQASGEIDMANADTFSSRLLNAISNEERGVVIDASALSYIDSAGVRLLFELANSLTARRQRLAVVVAPRGPVAQILRVVSFEKVAPLTDSIDEALDALDTAGI
jgi:anti-anti-sigma factor